MTRYVLLLCGLLSFAACDRGGGGAASTPTSAPPAAAPAAPAPAPAPAAPAAAAAPVVLSDRVDDPGFELALVPSGPYSTGKLGTFAVALKPRGVYHVNQEYPMSITLKGDDALSFPKAELQKSDAAAFDEKAARFDVPFTAQKTGDHRVEARVRFAVCTPENCMPDERTLALTVAVK